MTFAFLPSPTRRRHGSEFVRKCYVAFAHGPLFAALIACGSATIAHANSDVSTLSPRSGCARTFHFANLRTTAKCSPTQEFASRLEYSDTIPNALARALNDGGDNSSRLPSVLSPPKLLVLMSLMLPAKIETRIERIGGLAFKTIVGTASMYDSTDPTDRDSGDLQTASGEQYDAAAWTAAIRTDLRGQFGGVGYGKDYRPAYALVETARKRAIVKINDVGPLAFGRVIDLNKRAMRYFDPSLQLGLIHDVRVIPLPGETWTVGPLGIDGEPIRLADGSDS